MRIAVGILATATALFTFGALGLLGTWSLVAATVVGLIGAIAVVTIMEEREHSQALVISLSDRRRPLQIDDVDAFEALPSA
jgi:hypothetical protein